MKANRLFIACVASLSLAACGGGTEFNATLSGQAERPNPVTTNASGTAKVTIDGNKLSVEGTFTGLSGNATLAHIHGPADETKEGPVFCDLSVPPASSGTIGEGTGSNACGAKELTDVELKNFEDGLMYVNIHTGMNPPGEIRGQLKK